MQNTLIIPSKYMTMDTRILDKSISRYHAYRMLNTIFPDDICDILMKSLCWRKLPNIRTIKRKEYITHGGPVYLYDPCKLREFIGFDYDDDIGKLFEYCSVRDNGNHTFLEIIIRTLSGFETYYNNKYIRTTSTPIKTLILQLDK